MFLSTSGLTKEEKKKERAERLKLIQEIWIAFMDQKNWTWEDAQQEKSRMKRPEGVKKLSVKHLCPALHPYTTADFKSAMELKPYPKDHIPKQHPSFSTSTMNNVSASGPLNAKENSNVQLPQSEASRVSTHGMKGIARAGMNHPDLLDSSMAKQDDYDETSLMSWSVRTQEKKESGFDGASRVSTHGMKGIARTGMNHPDRLDSSMAKQDDYDDASLMSTSVRTQEVKESDDASLMSWSVRTQEKKESGFDGTSRVSTHGMKGIARADFGSSCKPMARAKQTFTPRQHQSTQRSSSSEVNKKRARFDSQEGTTTPPTLPSIESVASVYPIPVDMKIVEVLLSRHVFSDMKRCSISNVLSSADLEKAAMVDDATQAMAGIDVSQLCHSQQDSNVASVDAAKEANRISIQKMTQLFNQAAILHGIDKQKASNARKWAEVQQKVAKEAEEEAVVSAQKMKMVEKVLNERIHTMGLLDALAKFADTGLKSSDEVLQMVLEYPLSDDDTRDLIQRTLSKRHPRKDRDDNSEQASRVASIFENLRLDSSQSSQASTTNLPFNHIQFASRDGDNDEVSVISGNTAGNSNLMRSDNPSQTRAGTVLPRVEEATDNGEDQQEEVIVEDASDDGNEGNNNLRSSTSTSNRARAQNESWMEPLGNSKQA